MGGGGIRDKQWGKKGCERKSKGGRLFDGGKY